MTTTKESAIIVPADVLTSVEQEYRANYAAITQKSGRLMLFAADQKVEHLNQDFFGPSIDRQANDPEHLFKIASKGEIGAFATNFGLIARYGKQYPDINYIVKMNGKTNLVPTAHADPISRQLWTIDDLIEFKKNSELKIRGVGYTIYVGSIYESEMLAEAAQLIYQAHTHGLVTILWMYPRGASVKNEKDGALIAGVAGLAAALGSDFAKINPPLADKDMDSAQWLSIAAQAAGNTKLICSGGAIEKPELFLQELYNQIHHGGMAGNATGRNIHAHNEQYALAMTRAISAITQHGKSVKEAISYLKS
jgi:fructose-bisphosphate aldolase/6-deoxy-5-ketofructose 1-phosphate synthase